MKTKLVQSFKTHCKWMDKNIFNPIFYD